MMHKIAMSGVTGFVGSHLSGTLGSKGCEIIPLGRSDFESAGPVDRIRGADTVINLAGAPIINRWTKAYKKELYASRINTTKSLVTAFSQMDPKPGLFISTSAVGYYPPGGPYTEEDEKKADDFLGKLTRDWENEALKAEDAGIRTVIFRFGVVLGKDGGALKQMLTPFKLGMGGTVGDGSQPLSWIHMKDLIRAYEAVIENMDYSGTYNLTAPNPTTNKGFTLALGKALHRPALFKIPKFVMHAKLGEGAQILTSGQHVIPARLIESGFNFLFPEIEGAVKDCVS